MPFPNEETQWKKGQSGNPNGVPKGTIHLSTHIQNALNDPDFQVKLEDGTLLKEMPIKAIIKTAVAKSISGDTRAMEWLAKHGYGTNVDITSGGDKIQPLLVRFIGDDNKQG